jgi:hypothetical protein
MGSIHIDEKFYIAPLGANRTEDQLDNSAPLGSFFQIRKVDLPPYALDETLTEDFISM